MQNLTQEQMDKLQLYQEITQVDSLDECLHALEAHNWNLEQAVQLQFNENAHEAPPVVQQQQQQQQGQPRNLVEAEVKVHLQVQHFLHYHNQETQPHGLIQWGYFIIMLPLRLIFSSLYDLLKWFWTLFETRERHRNAIEYNPLENINDYTQYFDEKYGRAHPQFYQGSYAQAVAEAKRNLKYLIVYLHDRESIDCDKFVRETLVDARIVNNLNERVFLFWSCSCELAEGRKVYAALRATRCPFIGIIVLHENRMTLVTKIEGPIQANELHVQLNRARAENDVYLNEQRLAQRQREETTLLRQEQDAAFANLLKTDRERERKVREEKEAKERKEREEKREYEQEQELKQRLRREFHTHQVDAQTSNSIKLSFKFPSGRRYERIFLKTEPLKNLYNFVYCQDECPKNFSINTTYPSRLIECDRSSEHTIEESKIVTSMILMVIDLDA